MVALIPARAGSTRCPGKNTRLLACHPLIAYTIAAAQQSGVFSEIVVCTDDQRARSVARDFGTKVYWRMPVEADQCDIVWIRQWLKFNGRPDAFALLRPTSPFRTAETIQRAYQQFQAMADCGDSIRAVEPVTQTPFKMWTWEGPGTPIRPLFDLKHPDGVPYHSSPTQSLPVVYIQNSSLEMSWTSNVECHGTIHGRKVGGFFTQDNEGFSIDTEADWREAVRLVESGEACLPPLPVGITRAEASA